MDEQVVYLPLNTKAYNQIRLNIQMDFMVCKAGDTKDKQSKCHVHSEAHTFSTLSTGRIKRLHAKCKLHFLCVDL